MSMDGVASVGMSLQLDEHKLELNAICVEQEKEDGGRGRFKSHSNVPSRISDREKKAPLKT